MNIDAKKKLLKKVPYGLYVIGVKIGERMHAFTGSWFSQVSFHPPMVMLGVKLDSKAFPMVKQGRVFTVNFIGKEDEAILRHYFKPVPQKGYQLGDYTFHTQKTGALILDDAVGYLECAVKHIVENYGDHAVVLAEVIAAEVKKDIKPLVMSDTPWHYGG